MNGQSLCGIYPTEGADNNTATESIGWLDSPHALDDTVKRLAEVKAIGIDAGL